MSLQPATIEELQRAVREAHARHQALEPLDLSRLNRVVEHQPADLTCTVESGCTVAALQEALGTHGQWLPVDPPFPHRVSIRELIDGNLTGPRRFRYRTVRDYLIGLEVLLADGQWVRSGGRVVKSVAGFDLHKLFVGSQGVLGIPVRATFKLNPRPPCSVVLKRRCETTDEVLQAAEAVRVHLREAVAIDLLDCDPIEPGFLLIVELAGSPQEVGRARERAVGFGLVPADLGNWSERFEEQVGPPIDQVSVLPGRLKEVLGQLGDRPFLARAGCGIVFHPAPALNARTTPRKPMPLANRLKRAFDPHGVFPALEP